MEKKKKKNRRNTTANAVLDSVRPTNTTAASRHEAWLHGNVSRSMCQSSEWLSFHQITPCLFLILVETARFEMRLWNIMSSVIMPSIVVVGLAVITIKPQPVNNQSSVLISCTFKRTEFGMYMCRVCTLKVIFFCQSNQIKEIPPLLFRCVTDKENNQWTPVTSYTIVSA